jgi:hypothetical protein
VLSCAPLTAAVASLPQVYGILIGEDVLRKGNELKWVGMMDN